MTKYPLATTTWDQKELDAIAEVIESGRFTMGARVKAFEEEFASFVGAKFAVMVNSGSSANLLAVGAPFFRKERPLARGDEVIVPAVSWSTTYAPLAQYGLHLKFVDVDRQTFNMCLDGLQEAITPRTRAVFAVNLLGNPNDFGRMESMLKERGITLLEDNCESLGATFGGQQAGTFGEIGTFSTFFSHHMCTMEGGLAVTDDEELYQIMLSLRAHGWTRDLPQPNLITEGKPQTDFLEAFRFVLPGYNLRPLEMEGAIGSVQLRKLPGMIDQRRANAEIFQDLFQDHPSLRIQEEVGESSWFGFGIVLDSSVVRSRQSVLDELTQAGVETRPIVAGNFARNETIRHYDHDIMGPLSVADELTDWGFFVGNHHFPLDRELELLRQIIDVSAGG